ncbi:MAG: 3-hydroxyacyl-ACP dehydratase [Niabella sp.]
MLIENLYTLNAFNSQDNKVTATIKINAVHTIFEGHFPGQPILPGVCQLQIIKELLERAAGRKLLLSEAGNCKFLQMADPEKTSVLNIHIDYLPSGAGISCNAVIKSGETVFLKMTAYFKYVHLA